MRLLELIVAATCAIGGQALAFPEVRAKVVFLRGNELFSANADGTGLQQLTHDGIPKSNPTWSPRGDKIAYLVAQDQTPDSSSRGEIIIITASGQPVSLVPVLAREPDGTIVGGLRFIEGIGWSDEMNVFATGSANPYVAECRVMDGGSGRVITSYFGTGFSACPTRGEIAYFDRTNSQLSLFVNNKALPISKTLFTTESVPTSIEWSATCDRLALAVKNGAKVNFVVLREGSIESRNEQSKDNWTLAQWRNTFLVRSFDRVLIYDAGKRAFRAAPEEGHALDLQRNERNAIVQKLGGHAPHWWSPRQ